MLFVIIVKYFAVIVIIRNILMRLPNMNNNNTKPFDFESSDKKRFGYQMSALGMYLTGAALILSVPIIFVTSPVAVPLSAAAVVGLISGGIASFVVGSGFSAAKGAELSKQQRHATIQAASYRGEEPAKAPLVEQSMNEASKPAGKSFKEALNKERESSANDLSVHRA